MLNNLIEKLKKVKDERKEKGKRYPLWFILLIIILTIMQGSLGYRESENFAKINKNELSYILKLRG
jgi:type VI protein secretion system component VasF